jgi:cell shape-determining protein MreC
LFHIFDSLVILVAFVIEVTLHGMEEELGSLVVVLRLWRVFQIIEELRSASEDTMEIYEDEMESLRQENASLKQRLNLNIGDEGTA